MKPGRFSAFLLLLSLIAVAPSLAAAPAPRSVGVFLDFDSAPSLISLDRMKREIVSIMQPSGLAFEWHPGSDRELHLDFPDLVVVRFHGACDPSAALYSAYSPEAEAAALASTAVSEGRVLPFSEISCDDIRRYIAPLLRRRLDLDVALGRALGRVVAHEMYHMLLERKAHAVSGIARSYHRRAELLAPRFRFDPRETEQLRVYGLRLHDK